MTTAPGALRRVTCDRHEIRELTDGWSVLGSEPGALDRPPPADERGWSPAQVPGTVAGALGVRDSSVLDGHDWWFRAHLTAERPGTGEQLALVLDGVATLSEVYLNGERIAAGESMFAPYEVDVGGLIRDGDNELAICCRALTPRLRERRRPRARWRTKLVSEGNLRFFRTMLLGRAPGFAPGPAVVGPWRPIRLERRRGAVLEALRLRPSVRGDAGVLVLSATVRALPGAPPPAEASLKLTRNGVVHRAVVAVDGSTLTGELRVDDVERWWPHTHGEPALYDAALSVDGLTFDLGRVGFRTLDTGTDVERDGVQLTVNGVPVFARGAVWTPLDLARPYSDETQLRGVLELVAEAGMNMLRVPGTGCYESERFHELCDELGILVWQDFMFANLDYPDSDPEFMRTVEREARVQVERLGGRPSTAVFCGSSEVAQQIAMLGLDPELARGPLYGELLPGVLADAGLDAAYVPSTPWGGDMPFRTDQGVANYYGVGAYLRPLEDARRADVKFAAECLAFANVPDEDALERIDAPGGLTPIHPRWKAAVPRDAGAGWDFDDVRDHYLRLLFGVDPVNLRSIDPDRYFELSRIVSGEVMAEVFGEWRRAASGCGGGLVLWLTDLALGAGWGVLDARGEPKVAYHHLRRALAPVAVWTTDEGLGGIAIHVANDTNEPFEGELRLALYRDLEVAVAEERIRMELESHGVFTDNVERVLGRFVDAARAYRFGPPAQDLIVVSLEQSGGQNAGNGSQCFRLPAGRPTAQESAQRLGVSATLRCDSEEHATVRLSSRRFLYGARITVPGYRALDDALSVEPGHEREVRLLALPGAEGGRGTLTALNLSGRVAITEDEE